VKARRASAAADRAAYRESVREFRRQQDTVREVISFLDNMPGEPALRDHEAARLADMLRELF